MNRPGPRIDSLPASPAECDHLRVTINGILVPYSKDTRSRTVQGHCDDCGGTVSREITDDVLATTALPLPKWQLRA